MWVFGYGSLMWDGWEVARGCTRRSVAQLRGYCRTFNKASIRNWGTKGTPCPTLNLQAVEFEVCQGVAFEFLDPQESEILQYLTLREGTGFELDELPVSLDDNDQVLAHVPIYKGKNIIPATSLTDVSIMVPIARGTEGTCRSYVEGIANKLLEMDIRDRTVTALLASLKDASQT